MRQLDQMKVKIRSCQVEANRTGVTEKVNLVPSTGQSRSESGGENTAPADQRKTGDPNSKTIPAHFFPT